MNPGHVIGWLLAASAAAAAVAVAVGAVRHFRRAWRPARRTMQLAALDAAVARHPSGSKLPGPGKPQASGVSRHEETGISEWTDADLAFLRGEGDGRD